MKRSAIVRAQLAALKPPKKSAIPKEPSPLEAQFDLSWRALDGPDLIPEYKFALPRQWRFDRLHPASRVAIELEGGVWSGGRHIHPTGFEEDCQKYNRAAALGYRVFRVTRKMLDEDPLGVLNEIAAAIMRVDPYSDVPIQPTLMKGT